MEIDLSKKLVFQLKAIYKNVALPFPKEITPIQMRCTELNDSEANITHNTTWFITADGTFYPGNILETYYEQV